MKPAVDCPKLAAVAAACNSSFGPCNPSGVLRSLALALEELSAFDVRHHPAVKVVVGHTSFLLGESLGPSPAAIRECADWLNGGAA